MSRFGDQFTAADTLAFVGDLTYFGAEKRIAFRTDEAVIALSAAHNIDDAYYIDAEENETGRANGIVGEVAKADALQCGQSQPRWQCHEHGKNDNTQFELRYASPAFVFEFGPGEHHRCFFKICSRALRVGKPA